MLNILIVAVASILTAIGMVLILWCLALATVARERREQLERLKAYRRHKAAAALNGQAGPGGKR